MKSYLPTSFAGVSKLLAMVIFLFALLFSSTSGFGDDKDGKKFSKADAAFFETSIRPVLSKNCYGCHGPKKQKSGLRLDSKELMLEGSDSGEILVPGEIDDSLLIDVLERDEGQMPPGKRLSEGEISDLKHWVALGAPWPVAASRETSTVGFSESEKNYWAFQPLANSSPPVVDNKSIINDIDRFVSANLKTKNAELEPVASKIALMRRVYFDVVGVPPSPAEQKEFLEDSSENAYQKLVDRLLADKRYGEKWGRHWLDLVRYAESDGYKQDDYRPNAWRYRDYVIQSFNSDKPYDQFVIQQLAGDELDPNDPENLVATGFLRHWIYEYNQRDVRTQWDTILNDVTNVTGDVFLAMSMNCARCHDHKFDPILQKDYFRLKAFFAPLLPRDDIPLATRQQREEFVAKEKIWLEKTKLIREQIDEIETVYHQKKMGPEIQKFPLDIRPMMKKASLERDSFETQLTDLAFRQVKKLTADEMSKKLKGDVKKRWETLRLELAKFDSIKPKPLPKVLAVTDTGSDAPETLISDDASAGPIQPGILSVIDESDFPVSIVANSLPGDLREKTTGRRLALAKWIASKDNALTTRVIVNRIWQHHFGTGIVKSSSDFGTLGQPPADPQLLDWLTRKFINDGWKFKSLHRLILMSATYRQATSKSVNPRLIPFRHSIRRLDAEQIRDAMLSVSGELDEKQGGPGSDLNSVRRTIYTKVIRNRRDPFLDVFDAPDNFNSTSQRNRTTTPTQSLLMINGGWTLKRATQFAKRVSEKKNVQDKIEFAYRLAFCRSPSGSELASGMAFLGEAPEQSELVDYCHVLLNSNEFLYVD